MRPLQRSVENGVTLSFLDDTGKVDIGWDQVQRVTRMRYLGTQGAVVDLGYSYDRANNRTSGTRNTDGTSDLRRGPLTHWSWFGWSAEDAVPDGRGASSSPHRTSAHNQTCAMPPSTNNSVPVT
jgi:hypothetical protein